MEGAEQQKGRADCMQASEQDLTDEALSAVHGDLSRPWPSLITSGAALIPHSGQCSSLEFVREVILSVRLTSSLRAVELGSSASERGWRCDEVERILIYPPPLAPIFCLWTAR